MLWHLASHAERTMGPRASLGGVATCPGRFFRGRRRHLVLIMILPGWASLPVPCTARQDPRTDTAVKPRVSTMRTFHANTTTDGGGPSVGRIRLAPRRGSASPGHFD